MKQKSVSFKMKNKETVKRENNRIRDRDKSRSNN